MTKHLTVKNLVSFADERGLDACAKLERVDRSKLGQFFSPVETASYLASCFSDASFSKEVVLLDPGAGCGILTAAFVESLISRAKAKQITLPDRVVLASCERDGHFIPALNDVLSHCKIALECEGISTDVRVLKGDWIELGVEQIDEGLLPVEPQPKATHVILNPPYKKLATSSRQRRILSRVGIETSNLYSAFVWLCFLRLEPTGELCAISPRSFCNGPYFKPFRKALLEKNHIVLLHQIGARDEVFERDKILQENIIYLLRNKPSNNGKITLAFGGFKNPTIQRLSETDVVCPNDPEYFIHLATEAGARDARDFVMQQQASLQDLGINISTGPVVDFRLREDLTRQLQADTFPLIYPHLIKNGKVARPPLNSDDCENVRQRKKPVGIRSTQRTEKFLVNRGCYVLIKRFTSKEEKRRLVACVLDPKDFPEAQIGIENHLNYFHSNGKGLPIKLAKGLAAYLNSSQVDQYFRQFNGHTQVNATDLRNLRYPTRDQLIRPDFE